LRTYTHGEQGGGNNGEFHGEREATLQGGLRERETVAIVNVTDPNCSLIDAVSERLRLKRKA
jgi:hypothetical protein